MINRRLTAVNILIVTVCLMIVTFSAYFALQSMFYRENTIIYNQLFNESCDDFKSILDEAEKYCLRICASDDIQQLLKKDHPASSEAFAEMPAPREEYLPLWRDLSRISVSLAIFLSLSATPFEISGTQSG